MNSRDEIYEYDNLEQLLGITLDRYAKEQDGVRIYTNEAHIIPTDITISPIG